jgi:hypothetical protein
LPIRFTPPNNDKARPRWASGATSLTKESRASSQTDQAQPIAKTSAA